MNGRSTNTTLGSQDADTARSRFRWSVSPALLWASIISVLWVVFIAYLDFYNDYLGEGQLYAKDPMQFTFFLTVLFLATGSLFLDESPEQVIEKWKTSGILSVTDETSHKIIFKITRWQIFLSIIVAITFLILLIMFRLTQIVEFITPPYNKETAAKGLFLIGCTLAAVLFGVRAGRLVGSTAVTIMLLSNGATFRINQHHPDGAGGLTRIGAYHMRQTMPLAIACCWLIFWWFSIKTNTSFFLPSLVPELPSQYASWEETIRETFFFLVLLPSISFGVPIMIVSLVMRRWKKNERLREMEAIETKLDSLNAGRAMDQDTLGEKQELSAYLHRLANFPNYPISPTVWTITLTTVLAPLILNILTATVSFPSLGS